jgi:hypothetical protein
LISINNLNFKIYKNILIMAFLKEDAGFTHVVAIDFGTGASGYFF